jgi:hypothetical protein
VRLLDSNKIPFAFRFLFNFLLFGTVGCGLQFSLSGFGQAEYYFWLPIISILSLYPCAAAIIMRIIECVQVVELFINSLSLKKRS